MTKETVPGSVETTDNLRIAFVPAGTGNPLSVAVLAASTTKDITYSLTPDGWAFPQNETEIPDERLALGDGGSRPGRSKKGPITTKYVYGTVGDVAKVALAAGTEGTIVYRDVVGNEVAWTAAQKVDTIEIVCGRQRKDAVAADGLFTTSQTHYVKAGGHKDEQTLVA